MSPNERLPNQAWAKVFLCLFPLTASPTLAACREIDVPHGFPRPTYAAETDATIRYLGHNFFHITTSKGNQLPTDPLGPGWYPDPVVSAHVVTVGREHFNHNYVEVIRDRPLVLRGLSDLTDDWNRVSINIRKVFVYNNPLYQNGADGDYHKGASFVFDLGNLCIAHLGDLSHRLTPHQLKLIGKIDIALTPIGGEIHYGAPERTGGHTPAQAEDRHPDALSDDPNRVEEFSEGYPVRTMDSDTFLTSKSALPSSTEIVVLTPHGAVRYE